MKLLCLVALAVCAVQAANPQDEILAPGTSVTKNLENSQYALQLVAPNIEDISDVDHVDLTEYESNNYVQNRFGAALIHEALEQLRHIIIHGSDDLPVLDPLAIKQLGPYEYRITGVRAEGTVRNLRMEGLRWFVADRININPIRLSIGITMTIPWLTITGGYDTNARIAFVSHKAGGNFRIFAHRIEVSVDMRLGTNLWAGHLVLRTLDIKIDIHDTQISITGMTGSSVLNSLISSAIQNVSQDIIQSQMESISKRLSEELFDTINEVLKDYTISDIFG